MTVTHSYGRTNQRADTWMSVLWDLVIWLFFLHDLALIMMIRFNILKGRCYLPDTWQRHREAEIGGVFESYVGLEIATHIQWIRYDLLVLDSWSV